MSKKSESKPIMMKNKKQSDQKQPISGAGKQNKKPSQNNKKLFKNISASGFKNITN